MELISIIIPTYKTNDSLIRAIDSCLNQTYKNLEVVVVDDNIPESKYRNIAEKIMSNYKNDNRVIYIKNPRNMNGSASRNNGVKNCHGKWIGFLDDDDYFELNKVEKQIAMLRKSNSEFCTCYYKRNNNLISFDVKNDYIFDTLMNYSVPQTSSFVLSKKLFNEIGGFDEDFFRHQDYEFLIRVCEETNVVVVDEALYTLGYNNVNNVPNGEKLEIIKNKFLKKFDYIIVNYKFNRKKIYARNFSLVFIAYLKNKNIKKALKVFFDNFNIYFIYYVFYKLICSIKYKIKGK